MNKIQISRENGVYPEQKVVDTLNRFGVVVLKGLIPCDLLNELRTAVKKRLEIARKRGSVLKNKLYPKADFLLGDILAVRELANVDFLFFKKELLQIIKAVLQTEKLLYWGDSSIQFGEAARGFHKDNVNRHDGSHEDWQGDYGLVRCGFYFQNHANYSGGLKVRLSSQNIPTHHVGKIQDINSNFGDLVFWSMRLTHSGNNRKIKFLKNIPLHPRIEMKLPKFITAPEHLSRISAFCAFGKPGKHVETYIQNMNKRDADYRPYFLWSRNESETKKILEKYQVDFLKPNDYYGQNDK